MAIKSASKAREKKILIIGAALVVMYLFYAFVMEPIRLKAMVARADGAVNTSVPASNLVRGDDLPFLRTQSQSSADVSGIADDVFYVAVQAKPEVTTTKQITETIKPQTDYLAIAKNYYRVELITDEGAVINGTFYLYKNGMNDLPQIFTTNKVAVKLKGRSATEKVTLLIDGAPLTVAVK